ncbi:MAG: outer membrane lipid asymmetry maintenance protein MlaD [Chromatiales bacterium]|jgi:phospholipid/cholesterol/gamma-HCH transport system substrate-binding protein|nr:outer membrane lipid asymmetry maintenance protein MlaD [Chromatiales bacterium]
MMGTRTIEIMVGVFVAAGIAALFVLALKVSNFGQTSVRGGYQLTAKFENIGGLRAQSPVSAAGVRVGQVTSIVYDQKDYEALVTMTIAPNFNRFPSDTSASIYTSGLLGEQYIGLEPGGAEDFLKNGDYIQLTQSALVIEQLIGKFLVSMSEGKDAQR